MVHAVGEEEVVQVLAPVGVEAALAQELVLLPRAFAGRPLFDGADGAPDGRPRARDRGDAANDAYYEQQDDDGVDRQVDDGVQPA